LHASTWAEIAFGLLCGPSRFLPDRAHIDEEGRASVATARRTRKLERELARKEKALAKAAALLVLTK
jgi:hypothetical protein